MPARTAALQAPLYTRRRGGRGVRGRLRSVERGAVATATEDNTLSLLQARVESLEREVTLLHEARRRAARNERIAATMEWIRRVDVPAGALVSVVMSTHDRADVVGRAIASVQAQSYPNWELVVIDHDSADETPAVLAAVRDERVRSERVTTSHSEALNRGLARARGEIVAYLDDDNIMHPDWLRSVVWAFGDRPDIDVLYGAVVVQYGHLDDGHDYNFMPHINLLPWSRTTVEQQAITDHGAVAHRAGLDEARFVELPAARDWEMMLRLTATRGALALPALALMYFEDAPDRVTDRVDHPAIQAEIAAAHGLAAPRPYLGGRRGLLLRISELESANAEQSDALRRVTEERDALARERDRLGPDAVARTAPPA